MFDPCCHCIDYPTNCPTLCTDKMKYINEGHSKTKNIPKNIKYASKEKKQKTFIKRELNKHGIVREIVCTKER